MRHRGVFERPKGSGIWWARYADAAGKIRREKAGGHKAACTLYNVRRLEAVETRKVPQLHRRRVLFSELAQDTLDYRRQQKTAATDQSRIALLLGWWKDLPADALTPKEIEHRLARPEWSNATANRYRALISFIYRIGVRRAKVAHNPARLVPTRRESDPRQGFVDDAQYSKLAGLCPSVWMRALLALAYTYGWRRGELLGLRVAQVNLPEHCIRLEPGSTKNREGRIVKLTAEAYELVRACAQGKEPGEFLFTREDGSCVRDFSKTWADISVAAALGRFICRRCQTPGRPCTTCANAKRHTSYAYQGLIFHDLRRSAVRNLERAGVPRSVAMKITGHKTESVYRRYAIVSPADLTEAVSRLERSRQVAPELAPETSSEKLTSAKLN